MKRMGILVAVVVALLVPREFALSFCLLPRLHLSLKRLAGG